LSALLLSKPSVKKKKLLGAVDKIDFPEFGLQDVDCKIDTGAQTSALHCHKVKIVQRNGKEYISFRLLHSDRKVNFLTSNFKEKIVRSSSGHVDIRYTIRTKVVVRGRKITTEFTLANREKMKYPVLLGKSLLKGRFKVDVELENLSYYSKLKRLVKSQMLLSDFEGEQSDYSQKNTHHPKPEHNFRLGDV
jgi:hypothetical protein